MSLLLAYHDSKRALVVSDDLAVVFDSAGRLEKAEGRFPKFALMGAFILCIVGRSDLCSILRRGTSRLLEANRDLPVADAARIVAEAAKTAWAKRSPASKDAPLNTDALEGALVGYCSKQQRVRAFGLCSYGDFSLFETTADPNARIFALGAYGPHDKPLLEKLTKQMRHAENMAPYWIAWQLKKTMKEMALRDPNHVGPPSFYAALGSDGFLDLPAEYPLPPAEELASSAAHLCTKIKHFVTTIKEQALAGAGRFFVGSVTTPDAGQSDTIGNNDGGSGAQYGMQNTHFFPFATFQNVANGGNATKGTEKNIIDGDFTDSCSYTVTGNSSAANVAQSSLNNTNLSIFRKPESITAKVLYDVTTNTLNGANGPSRFNIDITYTVAGVVTHNNVVILTQGQTAAKQIASVSVPVGASAMAINITAQTLASDTAGQLIAHVYEFWADVVE